MAKAAVAWSDYQEERLGWRNSRYKEADRHMLKRKKAKGVNKNMCTAEASYNTW